MTDVWIIVPAHNRRDYTLDCVKRLRDQGAVSDMTVLVVDDGSTDGTGEELHQRFPETVVLKADGDLYWTGAVALGMRHAMQRGARAMVWLNDDAIPYPEAIRKVVERALQTGGIASGQGFVEQGGQGRWYFPLLHKGRRRLEQEPVRKPQGIHPCDGCRGNLVAVARSVVERIGYPDGKWVPHVNGDTDYSLRATSAGLPCEVVGDALIEERDTIRTNNQSWLLSDTSIWTVWKRAFRKNSFVYPPMWLVYRTRHWGWRGLAGFPVPYMKLAGVTLLRLLVPLPVLRRLFGARSHAWRVYEWVRKSECSKEPK